MNPKGAGAAEGCRRQVSYLRGPPEEKGPKEVLWLMLAAAFGVSSRLCQLPPHPRVPRLGKSRRLLEDSEHRGRQA